MRPNQQFPADLVTFTEEILSGKLHFLCSVCCRDNVKSLNVLLFDFCKSRIIVKLPTIELCGVLFNHTVKYDVMAIYLLNWSISTYCGAWGVHFNFNFGCEFCLVWILEVWNLRGNNNTEFTISSPLY